MFHRHSHHSRDCREHRHARDEFGFGGRHFGHRGRGFRGGRVFDHGDLRYVLLHFISEKPRHGYELIKAIEDKFGGTYSPSPGVIYPTLTMLEELGYATVSATDGNKKLYAITGEGTAFLAANRAAVDEVLARMDEASARHGGGPAPQIVRAVSNLKFALRLRLSRGPLSDEQIRAITAAIDAAAVEIERS
jgi:DNA-binding PadR family transcriptional regulator